MPDGWEFSGGLKTPGLGWTTWSLSNYRLVPYTRDMDCNGELKNSITIYEFDEIPEHYDKVSKGRVNIRIWADKIACSEAKRIDAEISSQRANELDAEKKSSTAKSLLESLK